MSLNKADFLKSNGWHTWYHPDYWVHPRVVANPSVQDYTNYGMSLDSAYSFELEKKPPQDPQMLPIQNMIEALKTLDIEGV